MDIREGKVFKNAMNGPPRSFILRNRVKKEIEKVTNDELI